MQWRCRLLIALLEGTSPAWDMALQATHCAMIEGHQPEVVQVGAQTIEVSADAPLPAATSDLQKYSMLARVFVAAPLAR